MSGDAAQLRYLAATGHFGHDALLAPDTFVQKAAPALGIQVAQNSLSGPNEFGISEKMNGIPQEPGKLKASADNRKEQDMSDYRAKMGLYQRLLMNSSSDALKQQGIEEPVLPEQ